MERQISYYGYTVSVTAEGSSKETWQPRACVSWAHGRQQIRLNSNDLFTTRREAEDYALNLGKQWVNERLGIFAN
jgi:hypothetical protein